MYDIWLNVYTPWWDATRSSSQLNRIIAYALFDIPQEYLFDYRNGLVATSTLDVLGASQRHLQPEDLQVMVCLLLNLQLTIVTVCF